MAQYHVKERDAFAYSTHDWDGYPANRARLLKRIHERQVSNPVVVGGDTHSFFANDLRLERAHMLTRMRVVSDVRDPKADVSTLRTFAIEGGKPGVVAA
jgi:alkaline phosphatase D